MTAKRLFAADDACYVFLLRHGATANNERQPPRIQGYRSDEVLSDLGRRQAAAAARRLAEEPLARVVASPLLRAQETAALVAAPHGVEVESIGALRECDVGSWEGRSWPQIEHEDPQSYALFREDPERNPYAGGENLGEVIARFAPAIAELMAASVGQSLCVVAHNVVNRTYLASVLGVPFVLGRSLTQNNCGINVLRWSGGKAKVVSMNSVFHLEGV